MDDTAFDMKLQELEDLNIHAYSYLHTHTWDT